MNFNVKREIMWHRDSLYSGHPSVSFAPGESHTCGKVIALSETESGKCGV